MKKRNVFLLLLLQFLIFSAAWIYFDWKAARTRHVKHYVSFFQTCVQMYAMKSALTKREPFFPGSLEELEADGELHSSDIYKIHLFIPDFSYHSPPHTQPPKDFYIFTGTFMGLQMECPLFGGVRYTKQ